MELHKYLADVQRVSVALLVVARNWQCNVGMNKCIWVWFFFLTIEVLCNSIYGYF